MPYQDPETGHFVTKEKYDKIMAAINARIAAKGESSVVVVPAVVALPEAPIAPVKPAIKVPKVMKAAEPAVVALTKGKHKEMSQAEKVLSVLMKKPGVVKLTEIIKTLGKEIEDYRMPVYLWELKKLGASVNKIKEGRKVVAVEILNKPSMEKYLAKRFPAVTS